MEATTKAVNQITDAVIEQNKAEKVSHAKQKATKKPEAAAIAKSAAKIAKDQTEKKAAKAAPKAKAPAKAKTPVKADANDNQQSLDLAPQPAPSNLVMMPLTLIETHKQVRTEFNEETLLELAEDIATRGMLQPLLLRPNPGHVNFVLIAGERRYRAAMLAGLTEAPAIIGEVSPESAKAMQLSENIQREDLSLKDLAAAVRDKYDETGSVTETAKTMKKSKSWVSKHLAASCPDLRQFAKEVLEGGFTEDLEIVLMLDKLQPLDWCGCRDLAEKIKSGNAGRQTVKDAYEAAKAKAEADAGEQEERNNPEAVAQRKAEQKRQQDLWEAQQRRNEEERQKNPIHICHIVIENYQTPPEEQTALTLAQHDILADHLLSFFEEARSAASGFEHLRKVIDMKFNEANELEIAAYVFGTFADTFDRDKILEQVERVIVESIA
ncbi:ParB/RepB/Spo0J family partition protein [uncultured Propionivibrio sp.]|uniref:ParB/RepB/Spo0J family partition protein n=1 Tax=uncultured Propionivibrio sp. TaxID=426737 RepID=UPI0029C0A64E|nr:ParB/RepB/Spo0J family partition protein [uncultured Propionivibrio sp.]